MIEKSQRRIRLCAALLVLNIAFIWGNSALPASVSGALSGWIRDLLSYLLPGEGQETQGDGLLRKLAHFCEFCALGALLLWLYGMLRRTWSSAVAVSVVCAAAVAGIDEIIQIFSPGRYPSILDVALDTAGAVFGVLLFTGYTFLKKRKNTNKWRITTMKKIFALMLVLAMALSMAACSSAGNNTNTATTEAKVNAPASALEVLENVWALYGDDEKFAVVGGNMEANIMDKPGNYDMAYAENLSWNLLIPEAEVANVDEAASMIHMMNANTFTSGVVHLKTGVDVKTFAETMKTTILGNQWMCGFPERVVIADMGGNYVLIAFGINDAMTPFCNKLAAAYPNATTLVDEPIA